MVIRINGKKMCWNNTIHLMFEIIIIAALLGYAFWIYKKYFVTDVDLQGFESLELPPECLKYLSSLKGRVKFQYSVMISTVITLIAAILLLLVQLQFGNISTPVYLIVLIVLAISSFATSYKIINCFVTRAICGGGNCYGESDMVK